MKKLSVLLVLSGICFALTGCASDYVISTNDGHLITTHGKPEIDKDTGLISYKDKAGNHYQLNRNQVKEIVEK
ncbi:YgdI/YgdR family lipoprotein [Gibbsiella quercinecans]|uniref:YgdI/YgdR family lipoprotein n=1 Tax=Gibbsiella quercinecans TaxID=929813 RepID=UPI00242D1538|nr:YgdI/YgdR family lipoprotein [Gibbsiella quercinecans]